MTGTHLRVTKEKIFWLALRRQEIGDRGQATGDRGQEIGDSRPRCSPRKETKRTVPDVPPVFLINEWETIAVILTQKFREFIKGIYVFFPEIV